MREMKLENSEAKFEERWVYPNSDRWDSVLRIWPPNANQEAVKRIEKTRKKNSWERKETLDKKLIYDENIAWLMEANPFLSSDEAKKLYGGREDISSLVRYKKNEYHLFSFYTVNEFLAQEDHDRYGDFLDARWDELYKLMHKGFFTCYEHTEKLFPAFKEKDSVLLHRPRSAAVVKDALENLNREQIARLVNYDARKLKASSTLVPEHIKGLLNDDKPQVYDEAMLKNKLYIGFSKAVASAGEQGAWSHLSVAHIFMKYIERIHRSFYQQERYAKPGMLPNSVLKPIADLIEKRGDEFLPYEILGIVFTLTSPDAVISAPKLHGLRAFIPFPSVPEDDQRQVLKLMGKMAVSYRGRIPTLAAWERFLTNGDAALAMDHELMFELMGGAEVLKANVLSKDLTEFRNSLPR
jgi:hypothetical protein